MKNLILIIVIFSLSSLFFVSCSQKQGTKKEINKENFLKRIDKARSSGKVLIIKTLRDSSCVKFTDMFGNPLIPGEYYYYINGNTIRKRFSMRSMSINTKSDFLANHKKIKTRVGIKSRGMNTGIPLKVELFNYQGDPSQMVME